MEQLKQYKTAGEYVEANAAALYERDRKILGADYKRYDKIAKEIHRTTFALALFETKQILDNLPPEQAKFYVKKAEFVCFFGREQEAEFFNSCIERIEKYSRDNNKPKQNVPPLTPVQKVREGEIG